MKNLFLLFSIIIAITSCENLSSPKTNNNNPPEFNLSLPKSFVKESNKVDKYNLLTASKYIDGEIYSIIEIKYSDDKSFSEISNEQLINEMLSTKKFDSIASHMFNNFKIHSKQKIYLKGVGNCFGCIYSGDYYLNGIRVTNFTVQFIKNNKMFTLIGSSIPELFSSNHKEFIEIFDTFEI